jgi:hypothetical protein
LRGVPDYLLKVRTSMSSYRLVSLTVSCRPLPHVASTSTYGNAGGERRS